MNKYIRRMEKTTANAVYRALQQDKRDVQEYLRSFDSQKGFLDSLENFLSRVGKRVVDAFIPRVESTITRASQDAISEHRDKIPSYSVDFSVATRPESVYLRALQDLHLSQKRWSISLTTTERVKDAVIKWTKEWLTYSQIADDIERLDPKVFSRNRAELIAINQVGKAYQFGEYGTMQELWNEWYLVMKYWSTVNDNWVTKTHTRNQNNGWIYLPDTFSGTGDLMPPASDNPRCRCANRYEVGELRDGEQPDDIKWIIAASNNSKNAREYLERVNMNYNPDNLSDNLNHAMWYIDERQEYQDLIKIKKDLTDKEVISLYEYSVFKYEQVNKALRSGSTMTDSNWMIVHMVSGMERLPPYTWTVWRGVKSERVIEQMWWMQVGDIFSDSGFMSTSKSKQIAEGFRWDNGILLKIKSKTGKSIDQFTWSDEEEILFRPWVSYRLLDKSGSNYILEEI